MEMSPSIISRDWFAFGILWRREIYGTIDLWDALAAKRNASLQSSAGKEASSDVTIQVVGRDIVSSSCLLRASASLRTTKSIVVAETRCTNGRGGFVKNCGCKIKE